MISSSGTSYRKKWNSSSAVAELAFRLSVICMQVDEELKGQIHTEMMKAILKFEIRVK